MIESTLYFKIKSTIKWAVGKLISKHLGYNYKVVFNRLKAVTTQFRLFLIKEKKDYH